MIFPTYEVSFEKNTFDDSIVVTGEIKNDSSRDYNMAIFRIILYMRNKRAGAGIVKVYDFKKSITKPFRAYIPPDSENVKASLIDRYEISIEGGY